MADVSNKNLAFLIARHEGHDFQIVSEDWDDYIESFRERIKGYREEVDLPFQT